jgi:DNA-binding NtrC family response regulator
MAQLSDTTVPPELTGNSARLRECLAQFERATADDRGVLLVAEGGLDAEGVARALHHRGRRRAGPFVAVGCGAPPAEIERVLFGPSGNRRGRDAGDDLESVSAGSALMRAGGGTLFLDEVGELPALVQRRLARVLRDGEARLRPSTRTRLDVRVIGATQSGVASGADDGRLRDDFVRRLPLVVDVPALRHRREDVPAIAEAILADRAPGRRFTPAAMTVLAALPWRRNIAELRTLVERLAAAQADTLIRQEDVLAEVQLDRPPIRQAGSLREARRQFERDYIAAVLRDHGWQMRDAARALGIERANLYRKARQLGIPLRREVAAVARVSR